MIERVIENWLDKSTEKSFQLPFCYMMADRGFSIYHLTRHGPQEIGKDVVAVSSDGEVCTFQLKGGSARRITIGKWQDDIFPQIETMANTAVDHPSIDSSSLHTPYFVTNQELDEEVWRHINQYNKQRRERNKTELEVISRGNLVNYFKDVGLQFIPSELDEYDNLLSLYLRNGKRPLQKHKLADLFESLLDIRNSENNSKAECLRRISSGAIICSIAVYPHASEDNYFAETQAWVIFYAHVLSLLEEKGISFEEAEEELRISKKRIFNSVLNLCDEVRQRDYYTQGDIMMDSSTYPIRMIWLKGIVSLVGIGIFKDHPDFQAYETNEKRDFIQEFVTDYSLSAELWGEAAMPYFLSIYWYLRSLYPGQESESFLRMIIREIINRNKIGSENPLLNPYYGAEKIARIKYRSRLSNIMPKDFVGEIETVDEKISGGSFYLIGLIHILARRNFKQSLKRLWPRASKFEFNHFVPEGDDNFYRWRSPEGSYDTVIPERTKHWSDLIETARVDDGEGVPSSLKEDPIIGLLFLMVYPHRVSPDFLRRLDSELCGICW